MVIKRKLSRDFVESMVVVELSCQGIYSMSMTYKRLSLKESRKSEQKAELDFLIDSGAFHSLVPSRVLLDLAVEPYRSVDIILADGSKMTRKVGDLYFELNGEGAVAPVIFGEEGEEPLLGATTLEALGLVLNPLKRELYPMRIRQM